VSASPNGAIGQMTATTMCMRATKAPRNPRRPTSSLRHSSFSREHATEAEADAASSRLTPARVWSSVDDEQLGISHSVIRTRVNGCCAACAGLAPQTVNGAAHPRRKIRSRRTDPDARSLQFMEALPCLRGTFGGRP
jgi:hypothetical protein